MPLFKTLILYKYYNPFQIKIKSVCGGVGREGIGIYKLGTVHRLGLTNLFTDTVFEFHSSLTRSGDFLSVDGLLEAGQNIKTIFHSPLITVF